MSHSRHPLIARPAAPEGLYAPDDLHAPGRGASLQASAAVTNADGTVLAEISRHTEQASGPDGLSLLVVDVAGDIDADTVPLLRIALTHAIRRNPRVCCDLSQVGFVGAAAVNTIVAALHEADAAGCAFTVRGVHGFGIHVFQVTGLDVVLASRS